MQNTNKADKETMPNMLSVECERMFAAEERAVTDEGKVPLKTELALQALIDAWIDERGCSRLVAAGRAADAVKREYEAISARVNIRN
jgi:hypothetical protein